MAILGGQGTEKNRDESKTKKGYFVVSRGAVVRKEGKKVPKNRKRASGERCLRFCRNEAKRGIKRKPRLKNGDEGGRLGQGYAGFDQRRSEKGKNRNYLEKTKVSSHLVPTKEVCSDHRN